MRAAEKYDAGVVFGEAEAVNFLRSGLPRPKIELGQARRPTDFRQSR